MGFSLSFVSWHGSLPKTKGPPGGGPFGRREAGYSSGTMSSATMLMILMSGFTAGPAVSL